MNGNAFWHSHNIAPPTRRHLLRATFTPNPDGTTLKQYSYALTFFVSESAAMKNPVTRPMSDLGHCTFGYSD